MRRAAKRSKVLWMIECQTHSFSLFAVRNGLEQ